MGLRQRLGCAHSASYVMSGSSFGVRHMSIQKEVEENLDRYGSQAKCLLASRRPSQNLRCLHRF